LPQGFKHDIYRVLSTASATKSPSNKWNPLKKYSFLVVCPIKEKKVVISVMLTVRSVAG
jgi:hypothetical protein